LIDSRLPQYFSVLGLSPLQGRLLEDSDALAPDGGTVYSPLNPYSLQRFIVIRTQADPATTMSEARQVVRALDPSAPLSNTATVDELVAQSLEQPQSLSLLIAGFAVVALLLSVIGIYGV
jgi:hypothetical protein